MSPESLTSRRMTALVGFALALTSATPAAADVAAPMLVYVYPGLILLLVPIILFEALVGCKVLGARFGIALKVSALANAPSTLLGVPIAWLALAVVILRPCAGCLPAPSAVQRHRGYDRPGHR